jgi:hypothetical protein
MLTTRGDATELDDVTFASPAVHAILEVRRSSLVRWLISPRRLIGQCGLTRPSTLRRPFRDWIIDAIREELALSRGKIWPTEVSSTLMSSSAFWRS